MLRLSCVLNHESVDYNVQIEQDHSEWPQLQLSNQKQESDLASHLIWLKMFDAEITAALLLNQKQNHMIWG